MAIVLFHKFDDETMVGADPSSDQVWIVTGTDNELDVHAKISAELPQSYLNMVLQNYKVKYKGGGLWEVPVHYGPFRYQFPPYQQSTDAPKIVFNTGGGTRKEYLSKATGAYVHSGKTATDFGGLIGVTDHGIEGVDIPTPAFGFSYSRLWIMSEAAALAHANAMAAITATINSVAWKGFPAKEIIFEGAGGSERAPGEFEVTYGFKHSKGQTLTVGSGVNSITGIDKAGWSYMWVRAKEKKDAASKKMTRVVEQVNVEQVFELVDFNTAIPI